MRKQLRLEQSFACDEDWNAMPGDSQRRHCAECNRTLVNLSKLTEIEAYAIAQKELKTGHFCCVFEIEDGRIHFAAAPSRVPNLVRAAALSLPLFAACESEEPSANAAVVEAVRAEAVAEEVENSEGHATEVGAASLSRSDRDASTDSNPGKDMAERKARTEAAKSLYFEVFVEDGHTKSNGDIYLMQKHRADRILRPHRRSVSMGIFIER